jgi:signal transduction histidine kinase
LGTGCDIISESLIEDNAVVSESVSRTVYSLSEVNDLDIYIVDGHGRVVLCGCNDFKSNHNCPHSNVLLHESFLAEISGETSVELSSIDGLYEHVNYAAFKKVSFGANGTLYVIAVSNVLTATELISLMFGMYTIAAIIPLIFMFVAEYSLVARITRPLKYMSIAAKSISKGDFSKRVPVMSNDEIGELSALFNKMTESLSRAEKTGKNFIANVSHELKTPMTTISGFIDGIVDGTIEKDRTDYYLRIVSDEVKRLSRLVQSMLSLARLESGDNQLNLVELRLCDTILNVVVSMEQNITLKELYVTGLDALTETTLTGDRDLLHQVVYNLTDNAVKYTPDRGEISFNLRRIGDFVEFKIKNTSVGIPENDIPHIFEKFYKLDKSRSDRKESLGLGLYICKTIVELHGGTIVASSVINDFTEFTVTLPINNDERRKR